MEYRGPMLVVKDMERSKAFYRKILEVDIVSDFGENVTFNGGLSLQTEESWIRFTGCDKEVFNYQNNTVEFYFEAKDFDGFIERTKGEELEFLRDVATMPWGQQVACFYDPDKHVIQVGEDLTVMVKRLAADGLTVDELGEKTFLGKEIVENMLSS